MNDYKMSELGQIKVRLQPAILRDFQALSTAERTAVVAAGMSPSGAAMAISATIAEAGGALDKRALLDLGRVWEARAWAVVGMEKLKDPSAVPEVLATVLMELARSTLPARRQAEVLGMLVEMARESMAEAKAGGVS